MKSIFTCCQPKNCSPTTKWQQSFGAGIKLSLMLLLSLIFSSNLISQTPPPPLCPGTTGPIYINGDPGDWPAALNNTSYTKKAYRPDINSELNKGALDDGYTQGTSNNQPIEEWRWVYGQTNSKGDIENAGALLIGKKLYFFGDRSAFNGTCEIGFWFLLDKVGPTGLGGTPGSPFSGTHRNGDLLVLNTFTSGGGAATPKVFIWLGKTATAPGGLVLQTGASSCSATNETTNYIAPGGVGGTSINIPPNGATSGSQLWQFASKVVGNTNRDAGVYYPPLFFEGVVDLESIAGASPCFQSFIMKTTTSANNTAANVDLVAGQFSGVPEPPVVKGDEKCFGFEAKATADCTGSTAQWYNAKGEFIQTGSSLTLPAGTAAGTYTYNVTCKNEEGCESSPKQVRIIINPQPTVDGLITLKTGIVLNSDDDYSIKLNLVHDADLTASALSGTGPYTYTWNRVGTQNGNTTFSPTTSTTTGNANFSINSILGLDLSYDFKVTALDSKGCSATDIVKISPTPGEAICNIVGPDPVCASSTGNVYTNKKLDNVTDQPAETGFSYKWEVTGNGTLASSTTSGGTISATVTAGSGAGSYTVTLTITNDAPGIMPQKICTKTATVKLVTLSLDKKDVTCFGGNNGSITATFSGGTAPYKAQIDAGNYVDPATSPYIFQGLSQGSHTVHILDVNGCEATKSITVKQPDELDLALTPKGATCYGSSNGSISAAVTGTPLSDLEINIDGGNFATVTSSPVSFTGLAAGSHTIILRRISDNTCKVTKSSTVTQPDKLALSLAKVDESCTGKDGSVTATFSGGSGSYEAKIDGGTFASATSAKLFGGLSAGSHTVVVRDANDYDCFISKAITVNPPTSCAHIFPTQTTCCNYLGGNVTTFQLQNVCTTVSGGLVSNAIPGVFFYYGDFTSSAGGATTIVVKQSRNTLLLKHFDPQNESNVRLFVDNCISVAPSSIKLGTGANAGNVEIKFNAVSGKKYVVSVKYDVKSIIGSTAPSGTAVYTFAMYLNGSSSASNNSTGQVNVVANCSDYTPAPTGNCPASSITTSVRIASGGDIQPEEPSVIAYPSPYYDVVNFQFTSPKAGKAQLEVYDILGRKLAVIYKGYLNAKIPINVKYSVPSLSRVALFYKLTVEDKTVQGNVLPKK